MNQAKKSILKSGLITILACAAPFVAAEDKNPASTAVTTKAVVTHYTDIATAIFEDALTAAKELKKSIKTLLDQPSQTNLEQAQELWRKARVPYMQSEVLRFGNSVMDDWEGRVNAWPLDEGLIDYVAPIYQGELGNVAANANIIANPTLTLGSTSIDLSNLSSDLLAEINELAGSEANVTIGYHAIEFLLWGQDLNGTEPGAGERPFTDFALGEKCTNGNCDRRRQYLVAVTDLLVSDLEFILGQWQKSSDKNYRDELLASPELGLQKMLFGMGSLSLGELAGERMKVALEAGSTEDEQDCFSDNTHNAHYYDALGIENIYFGRYQRTDGTWLRGASLSDLVQAKKPQTNTEATAAFAKTQQAMQRMVALAETNQPPMKFDQMIAEGNKTGAEVISNAINTLVQQTEAIERVAQVLGIAQLNPDTADHQF